MDILENIKNILIAPESDWIEVNDFLSKHLISDFPYETGIDDTAIDNHCVECVAVNNCWFKNETNKKPKKCYMILKKHQRYWLLPWQFRHWGYITRIATARSLQYPHQKHIK